jgi:hypothetical protein
MSFWMMLHYGIHDSYGKKTKKFHKVATAILLRIEGKKRSHHLTSVWLSRILPLDQLMSSLTAQLTFNVRKSP